MDDVYKIPQRIHYSRKGKCSPLPLPKIGVYSCYVIVVLCVCLLGSQRVWSVKTCLKCKVNYACITHI